VRDFELQKEGILQDIKVLRRGGLTKKARQIRADSIAKATNAIDKILVNRYLDERPRRTLRRRLFKSATVYKKTWTGSV